MPDFKNGWNKGSEKEKPPSGTSPEQRESEVKKELIVRAAEALKGFVKREEEWETNPTEEPKPLDQTPEARIQRHAGLWADGRRREHLSIDEKLPAIHELLEKNRVVIVQAETGAGKTTRIGQYELLENPRTRIIMTQTRRNAVRWNGKRIAGEMGSSHGGLVGWRLSGEEPLVSRETRLVLTVDQSVTNRIRRSGGRLPKGILIIDEAHERSIPTDLLLGIIKERAAHYPETKILITSATIDTEKFSKFFDGAPIESVKGRMFPVSTESIRLEKWEHHTQGASRAAGIVLDRFTKGELTIPTPDEKGTEVVSGGTVLVLLPGKEDIRDVMRSIERAANELNARDKIEILSCHGGSTPDEQDAVQAPLKPGMLRFVCGTEVLRSSVTVRNTIGVIDSLQIKRLVSDAKGVGHLQKIAISKAEADQGKGRAGRVQPGFYMPVSFGAEYESLNPYPTPAILQQPITNVVLQVAAIGRNARDFAFIDKPPTDKLDVAFTRLKRIGALDNEEKITETGELISQLPLDPERARVLLAAEMLNVLPEAVVLTGILEAENIFFHPNREHQKWTVEESIARQILSRVTKRKRWEEYAWERVGEPRDPSSVDMNDLPDWIAKKGGHWEVNASAYGFPLEGIGEVAELTRKQWAGADQSDFAGLVRAYRAFKTEEQRLRAEQPPQGAKESPGAWRRRALQEWCERWFINQKQIREAENTMRENLDELDDSPLRVRAPIAQNKEFSAEALTKALAAGLTDNVAKRGDRGFFGPLGGFQLGHESACPQSSDLVIVGGVRKSLSRKQQALYFADLAAPIKKEWLKEVMPQLCTSRRESDATYDPAADAIMETETSFYGDLELGREKVPAPYTGENARKFARWLADYGATHSIAREELKTVLLANQEQQRRASDLNTRVGGQPLKYYSRDELASFYEERLAGAWKIAEIEHPENFRLPPLDEAEMQTVLLDYPDTITILGSDIAVRYNTTGRYDEGGKYETALAPTVALGDLSEENRWMQLPDDGIRLPNGMLAVVELSVKQKGSYYGREFSGADIPALKEKVAAYLNRSQWDAWRERPDIPLPNLEDEHARAPDIITVPYGTSVIDETTPLIAYGTVTVNANRWSAADPHFKTEWFPTRSEAEEANGKARVELERMQNEQRDQKERQAVQEAVKQTRERLGSLYDELGYESDSDLRQRLYTRRYQSAPSGIPEMKQWETETDALIAEAETAVLEVRRKNEEAEQRLRGLARPFPFPMQEPGENTIYGMPVNEEGRPCEAEEATEWRLYAYKDGRLASMKGYRSQSRGATFTELVRDYLRDDPNLDAVLRNIPAEIRKPSELDPILEVVGGNIETARFAKAFAEAAREAAGGDRIRALRVLEREANAPYGRARRQSAILQNLPGIENTGAGGKFLGSGRANDVNPVLSGAVAWLRSQAEERKEVTAPPPTPPAAEGKVSQDALEALRQRFRRT